MTVYEYRVLSQKRYSYPQKTGGWFSNHPPVFSDTADHTGVLAGDAAHQQQQETVSQAGQRNAHQQGQQRGEPAPDVLLEEPDRSAGGGHGQGRTKNPLSPLQMQARDL